MQVDIVIADDHPVFRDGMRRLIQRFSPGASVREAATFAQAVALAEARAPQMFILDLSFPGFAIDPGIAELREAFPLASVLVVSMSDDEQTIDRTLAAGADGFVSKTAHASQLSEAIRMVLDGEPVRIGSSVEDLTVEPETAAPTALTLRQQEVLKMLTRGMSNKEIARVLEISPFTVRIHVSLVFKALGVSTRAAAAASGRELGF